MVFGVRRDVWTDSHVTTKIFEMDGLPIFLWYGAQLARLRRAGAPLLIMEVSKRLMRKKIKEDEQTKFSSSPFVSKMSASTNQLH